MIAACIVGANVAIIAIDGFVLASIQGGAFIGGARVIVVAKYGVWLSAPTESETDVVCGTQVLVIAGNPCGDIENTSRFR